MYNRSGNRKGVKRGVTKVSHDGYKEVLTMFQTGFKYLLYRGLVQLDPLTRFLDIF
jgi:hypothetical protein